jgi:hypothetical protein
MDTIAKDLESSLVTRLNVFRTVAPDLFFWILYTGALAARARKTSQIYRWYCQSLAEASAALRLNNWNETESLLEQFLYVSRASDRVAEEVWHDVISLRIRSHRDALETVLNVESSIDV